MFGHNLWMIASACGSAIIVFALLAYFTRRRGPKPFTLPRTKASDSWENQENSFADRRSSTRREGAPVRVYLTSPSLKGGQGDGYVVDRSTGGLRIALPMAVPGGTLLQVKAANAPENVPWVTVVVRSCRDAGQHFELGCEFDKTPPWNVLLLFG